MHAGAECRCTSTVHQTSGQGYAISVPYAGRAWKRTTLAALLTFGNVRWTSVKTNLKGPWWFDRAIRSSYYHKLSPKQNRQHVQVHANILLQDSESSRPKWKKKAKISFIWERNWIEDCLQVLLAGFIQSKCRRRAYTRYLKRQRSREIDGTPWLSRQWCGGNRDASRSEITCSRWQTALVRRDALFANRESQLSLFYFFLSSSSAPLSSREEQPQTRVCSYFVSFATGSGGWRVGEVVDLCACLFCALLTFLCSANSLRAVVFFYFFPPLVAWMPRRTTPRLPHSLPSIASSGVHTDNCSS